MLAPFALPAAVALLLMLVRFWITGHFLSPWAKAFTHPASLPWSAALEYLLDFFVSSGAGILIVFPLWYLARGMLTGLGRRALVLTLWWCVVSTLGGGGPQTLPYSQFMLPILAVLLVAVQEAMTIALDSKRRGFPQLTWVLFLLGMGGSALASKFPGDLGPLRVGALHRAWMNAHAPHTFGYSNQLGRESLQEEIKNTAFLRELGAFLRDNVDQDLSVLSPWPGAIGYVSGLQVIDALSRATPTPGRLRANAWNAIGPWDLGAVLDQEPDYIVPTLYQGADAPPAARIAAWWLEGLDQDPRSGQRRTRILERFAQYELITVPASRERAAGVRPGGRFYLMRRRALGLSPRLTLERRGDELLIGVRHRAHQQLVDLVVQVESEQGELLSMRPSGELGSAALLRARSTILLHPTGARSIELLRTPLPEAALRLRAVLLNPGAVNDDDPVCLPVEFELR